MDSFVESRRLTHGVGVMRIQPMPAIPTNSSSSNNHFDDCFITVEALSQVICINKFTIYHLLKKDPKKLPEVTRIWGRVLFKRSAVNAFIQAAGKSDELAPARRGRGRPPKSAKNFEGMQ